MEGETGAGPQKDPRPAGNTGLYPVLGRHCKLRGQWNSIKFTFCLLAVSGLMHLRKTILEALGIASNTVCKR